MATSKKTSSKKTTNFAPLKPVNLKGRSLDSLIENFSVKEVEYLVELSLRVKADKKAGNVKKQKEWLYGKNIVTLWEKDSTRTRCSFDVAAYDMGMEVSYVGPQGSNYGKKESIEDTAKVLGNFYDGIQFRGFSQEYVKVLARDSGVPVWNGLTDDEHPTQIIADLMTMVEEVGSFKKLKGKKFVFIGDYKNNMGHSEYAACAFAGMHCVLCGPSNYKKEMIPEFMEKLEKISKETGATIEFCDDKIKAAKDADFIYTDVWVSLGESFELFDKRIGELKDFQVDMRMIKAAKPTVKFLHCLPAFHDKRTKFAVEVAEKFGEKYPIVKNGEMEVTDEVFQSKYNVCFREAENRMHSIKAIMLATMAEPKVYARILK